MEAHSQVELLLQLHKLERNSSSTNKAEGMKRLEKRLESSLRKRYRRLRERKRTGIAVLKNGICTGCMLIYPKTHEMLRHDNPIHFCEFCGRILVITEK